MNTGMGRDRVEIRRLQVRTRLGVPAAERAQVQTVVVDIGMEPVGGCGGLGDRLERAVDYHAVVRRVAAVAGSGERRLVETLAVELAECLLAEFPVQAVEVAIEKAIIPQAEGVGVRVVRHRAGGE
jgi:dihydroneopterin aldolase